MKEFLKKYGIWLLLVFFGSLLVTLFFCMVIGFFATGEMSKSAWLAFWGGFLAFFGTVSLGFVSLWQNDNLRKQNNDLLRLEEEQRTPYIYISKQDNNLNKQYIVSTVARQDDGNLNGNTVNLAIKNAKNSRIISATVDKLIVNNEDKKIFECINTDFLPSEEKRLVFVFPEGMKNEVVLEFKVTFLVVNFNTEKYFQTMSFSRLNDNTIFNFQASKPIKEAQPHE